jgi:hypothetical protein
VRSINNQEELSVLDIHYSIPKSEPDDVRWEKVDHVRLMLANGTYRVSPEQVATKVIDQMLESGRDKHHWKGGRSSRTTNSNSGVAQLTIAGGGIKTNDMKANGGEASAANKHET